MSARLGRRSFLARMLALPLLAACSDDDGADTSVPATPPPSTRPAAAWLQHAPLPTPRSEVASAVLDGKIYVAGGFDASGRSTAVLEVYDPAADRWEARAAMPAPRDHAMAAAHAGRLFVFGGSLGEATRETFAYDPSVNAWTSLVVMPLRRTAGGAAVLGDRIFVVGGTGDNPIATMVFDPSGATWSLGPALPAPREHLAVVGTGPAIYVVGGRWEGELKSANENLSSLNGGWRRWPTFRRHAAALLEPWCVGESM
jgi:N-acetylneuraminic acid mutarotase